MLGVAFVILLEGLMTTGRKRHMEEEVSSSRGRYTKKEKGASL